MESNKNGYYLRVDKLQKQFGDATILDDIELTIEPGEFIAIVGRSGCGKSTLLRLISGLEEATHGGVYLDENKVEGVNLDTRFIFQEARLLPWRKIIDNVRIGAENKDKELALRALKDVGLEDRANEWPSVLSGGQKQRISLARALAGNAKLLLLDEPLGALDALTRIEMQQLIEKLWREKGFTVILVTHDVSEAVALADRVILVEKGKITMDTKITLARPRERNNDFVYFERRILDRVMNKETDTLPREEYAI
ncbi:ATP-binding cassette domain-containing protein [Clostridium sp. C2-6-12]|jgi:ABC-type nitrate/sulfonate/bicarbonate transport system, ATPase component|uniref:ATP-binding cassette domain-containing protein n=1 Tax=Clostridium sp. C2-6-12 TaxID=2698832 RepID=UPI001368CC45|nr:ATP-binding cassette domain-containing protein [Clostridium sp. C2-6-12]